MISPTPSSQVSVVQGALEQASKRLRGPHVERCVTEAFTAGEERGRKIEEQLDVFSRFGRRSR